MVIETDDHETPSASVLAYKSVMATVFEVISLYIEI
jgi:hypothetical protein